MDHDFATISDLVDGVVLSLRPGAHMHSGL